MFDIYGLSINPIIKSENTVTFIREADTLKRALVTVSRSTKFNTWAILDYPDRALRIYNCGKWIISFNVSETVEGTDIHQLVAWILFGIKV